MSNYENAFAHDNVYGHALDLLLDVIPRGVAGDGAIHLDLGCGHAAIAGPLTEASGLVYVGVDADRETVDALMQRGIEAHHLELGAEKETLLAIVEIIAGRRVASISMLDTLEHLYDVTGVLRVIRRLALDNECAAVISVPNVTHRDIGFKLALGDWQYTETGILDTTHTRFFSARSLERELAAGGLYRTVRRDVDLEVSDQHFPDSHSALAAGTTLHHLLRRLRSEAAPDESTNQFVWAVAPGPVSENLVYTAERNPARPFLSVVMRTQGRRLHCLREALTCLAGQTDDDFEVLVMGHRLEVQQQVGVERVIEDLPKSLRDRTHLIKVQHGNRVAPLNQGFAAAQGHYIVILDDDDIPLAHWVETFRRMADREPGRMLRAVAVLQNIDAVETNGQSGIRTAGGIEKLYPSEFDIFDHLRANFTPNMAIAFPRGVFHDLGMRFDPELTTTEDWDFIMRAAVVVGVASSPEITSIYHWWVRGESSRTVHHQREWDRNNGRIVRKLDSRALILPEGSASRIREVMAERDSAREAANAAALRPEPSRGGHTGADPRNLNEIAQILESRSWRLSAPLRLPGVLAAPSRRVRFSNYVAMSDDSLIHAAAELRRSRSWRVTSILRRRSSAGAADVR
ncbi:methyltransferase domain-containing protein [Cellulomonas sp. P22]|uniref:methyltransferase domain-containing protein n=1 Tax=Cellulomonas sp. P22 TaxID=3373189 RepID=UPI00378E0620